MNREGVEKIQKQKVQCKTKIPYLLYTHPSSKIWVTNYFLGYRNKPNGPYVNKKLWDWDKTKCLGRSTDRSGNMTQKYRKTKIFGKYRTAMKQEKNMDGKILEGKWWGRGHISHCELRAKETMKVNLPGIGSQRTRSTTAMSRKGREGWLQRCPFSYDQACCTQPLSNVMRPKRFLLDLILTLIWCLKKRIRSRREKFVPSYNPFFHVS